MGVDPGVFANYRPLDIGGNLLQGVAGANALVGMRRGALENKLLGTRVRQQGQVNALMAKPGAATDPGLVENIGATGDFEAAKAAGEFQQDVFSKNISLAQRQYDREEIQLEQMKAEQDKHALVHDAVGRTIANAQQEYRANPDMTPADKAEAINRFWQPERYQLDKALPPLPANLRNAPEGPLFQEGGGRGVYRTDVPQVLTSLDHAMAVHRMNGQYLSQYGQMMNLTTSQGTRTVQGTPGQLARTLREAQQEDPNAQFSKVGEKPVGLFHGSPEMIQAQEGAQKDFEHLPGTVRFDSLQADYGALRDAAQTRTGPGALTMITKYIKMHNPGIGVNEQGVVTGQDAAQNLPPWLVKVYQGLQTGDLTVSDPLVTKARQFVADEGHSLFLNELKNHQATRGYFDTVVAPRVGAKPGELTGAIKIRDEFAKPVEVKDATGGDGAPGALNVKGLAKGRDSVKNGETYMGTDGQPHIRKD